MTLRTALPALPRTALCAVTKPWRSGEDMEIDVMYKFHFSYINMFIYIHTYIFVDVFLDDLFFIYKYVHICG